MTKEEAQAKTQDKVRAIETLCRQLEVSLVAEQVIRADGIIKNMVFYVDNEKYDIKQDEKNVEKPADLRKEDTPDSIRDGSSPVGSGEGEKRPVVKKYFDKSRRNTD